MNNQHEYRAPEWAKHVVWYQIFPERFRNGDPNNDPTRERLGTPKNWEISPWTGDWYAQADWEKQMGDTFRDSVYKRRYGGDLQGIIDKLDYLKALGIGAIYLNPIFDAVSLHKYDTSYYHHVDRYFGPDPEGDARIIAREDPHDPATWQWTSADKLLLDLIDEVHKRDMKIVIDGVFNHTGTDFWAFRDLLENQRESRYKDWYAVRSFEDPDDPEAEFLYNSWWGVKSLPELKEQDETLVEPVRDHIFDVTRRWMDPNNDGDPSDGIDGWRLDVPDEIGKGFWREWTELVKSINPNAFTIGEIWTKKSREWINGELFDSSMNYPFAKAVHAYMIGRKMSTSEFLEDLRQFREDLPAEAPFVMQNLMDSHDTPRLASMIVNSDKKYNENGKPEEGFDVRKPNARERRLQKLVALFQYSYIGAPMIFYGTEAGMWGADDPDDRKPMVWKELDYEPETHHPFDEDRPTDDNNFDAQLFNWYQKLGNIRNNNLPLQEGEFRELVIDDDHNYFVFARVIDNQKFTLVAVNRSNNPQSISIPVNEFDVNELQFLKNLITGSHAEIFNGVIKITLPPVSGAILAPDND